MGVFDASLRTIGDRNGLPATITVLDGRLSIEAGQQAIGEWSLDEIRLEPTPTGYRMAAEGEHILLDIADTDTDSFDLALRGKRPKETKEARKERAKAVAEVVTDAPPQTEEAPPQTEDKAEEEAGSPERRKVRGLKLRVRGRKLKNAKPVDPGEEAGFLVELDRALEAAERRWGNLLPSWLFTRGMTGLVVAVLVIMVAAPQVLFYLMLLSGVLLVMLGAVLYTDSVMAARLLPGRMTVMHVLISGVGLLLLGVLVAMTAQNRLYVAVLGVVVLGAGYLATRITARRVS
jgi:hypothetical protein